MTSNLDLKFTSILDLNLNLDLILNKYKRIFLGYSGGLDSTVLLHLLSQTSLKEKIIPVHVNHGLHTNANAWANDCEIQANSWGFQLQIHCIQLEKKNNIEERARNARRDIFKSLLTSGDCLLFAHHANDQAETLLLNMMRGTGLQGASAMLPAMPFGQGTLLRPLLSLERELLFQYAEKNNLTWIEDESNQDTHYSRNFIRHSIIPLLKSRWPKCVNNMVRFTEACQGAQKNKLKIIHEAIDLTSARMPIDLFKSAENAYDLLYAWLSQHRVRVRSQKILQEIFHSVILAKDDAMPQITLDSMILRRYKNHLFLVKASESYSTINPILYSDVEYSIRVRVGGEVIRLNGRTQSLKKLFQAWSIPPWERATIPLLYYNDQLIAVAGYAVADNAPENVLQHPVLKKFI